MCTFYFKWNYYKIVDKLSRPKWVPIVMYISNDGVKDYRITFKKNVWWLFPMMIIIIMRMVFYALKKRIGWIKLWPVHESRLLSPHQIQCSSLLYLISDSSFVCHRLNTAWVQFLPPGKRNNLFYPPPSDGCFQSFCFEDILGYFYMFFSHMISDSIYFIEIKEETREKKILSIFK